MVLPTVKQEDVSKLFPKGVDVVKDMPSGKGYMRLTPDPVNDPQWFDIERNGHVSPAMLVSNS